MTQLYNVEIQEVGPVSHNDAYQWLLFTDKPIVKEEAEKMAGKIRKGYKNVEARVVPV